MNSLALYAPELDLSPLKRANLAEGTLKHYTTAILLLIAANVNIADRDELITYTNTLTHSGKANLKAALSIILDDYVLQAKISGKPVETIQRFIWAVDVIKETIKVKQSSTERNPHWLSQSQVDTITAAALSNSLRDYIVIGILLGAGLRREELEQLTFDALSQVPYENKMVDVLTVTGKGDKKRVIPIHPELARHIREWKAICKDGRIARRMYKGGKVGKSLTAPRIFAMVRQYGHIVGIEDLDPHDLRRSYGRIMYYENGKDILLVKSLLGHESVRTTQKYIGLDLNLQIDVFPVGGLQVAGD